jgi:hypothetical protein
VKNIWVDVALLGVKNTRVPKPNLRSAFPAFLMDVFLPSGVHCDLAEPSEQVAIDYQMTIAIPPL